MADPLSAWRKNPAVPGSEKQPDAEVLPDSADYRAFYPVDKEPKCLSIIAGGVAWVHGNYAYLQYVTEDAGRGRKFCIVYGFMVVEVKGRNLRPVADAIMRGNCAFIQQFDASKWKKPADTSAPIIDGIQFHHGAEKRGEMLSAPLNKPESQDA